MMLRFIMNRPTLRACPSWNFVPSQWCHNEHDGVTHHQPHDCLFNLYLCADQRKHQIAASLAFVRGIHQWPVNSQHKEPVTWKMFPFDDVIKPSQQLLHCYHWMYNLDIKPLSLNLCYHSYKPLVFIFWLIFMAHWGAFHYKDVLPA